MPSSTFLAAFVNFMDFSYLESLLSGCSFAFLRMNGLKHKSYRFHLVSRCNRKNVPVKMYGATLILGVRKDFRDGLQHRKPRWMNILVIRNLSALTAMITATDIRA